MSVAFTKEEDYEAAAADLPDRPISQQPNLVTREGMAKIEASLAEARAAYTAAQSHRTALARATRDLRYWSARRATAQLTEPQRDGETVVFGSTVTIERADGRIQQYRIVGEDEADPAQGSVSYVSPLAQALLGKRVGDEATAAGQALEITAVG
jgi:transcription elongation GreA/GreB family factor